MDEIYEILIREVYRYEGTVNEMPGDGVMALFGAPRSLESAPQRAVQAAFSVHREIARYSDQTRGKRSGASIRLRIGIHTGSVVFGALGNDLRAELKVVGDTVILAKRMEEIAEPGATYATAEIFMGAEGFFRFESLGERTVKGKKDPLKVYRAIAPRTMNTRFEVNIERGLTPFVGRERELELLLDGFERAKGGRGQAFSIVADHGIGKTRLLYEFAKAVASEDKIYRHTTCLSYRQSEAYHPVTVMLKANFDIQEGDSDREIRDKVADALEKTQVEPANTLPYLLELLSVKESGVAETLSPEERKRGFVDALRTIVLKNSEIKPLIMVIEDLQYMDRSSEEALRDLLEGIGGSRIMLLLTYRPGFALTWGDKTYHSRLTLSHLTRRESLTMASHCLGSGTLHSDLEKLVLEKTDGIPLFIEELLASLRDTGIIARRENRYEIVQDTQTLSIPTTIHGVLMARVDLLPENAKGVLRTGSVVGREFSHELMQRVSDLPDQELRANLAVLKDSELVYSRGVLPQVSYFFEHAYAREAVYDSILTGRRGKIHEKIGLALEALHSARLEEFYELLAYHYSKSPNLEKAYRYLRLSGEKAARNYANQEAFRLFKDAISTLDSLPATEETGRAQVEVRLSMYIPMLFLDFPENSLEILQEGERLAKELADEKSLATFYSRLGHYYTVKGRNPRLGFEYLEKCLKEAHKIEDIDLIAPAALSLCESLNEYGEYTKIADLIPSILALLEENELCNGVYSELCIHCGSSLGNLGNYQEGEGLIEKGLNNAVEVGDPLDMSFGEMASGLFYALRGNGGSATEHFRRSLVHSEEADWDFMIGAAWSGLGFSHYLLGDPATAQRYIERGIKIQTESSAGNVNTLHYCFLGMVHCDLGDPEQAQEVLVKILESSHRDNKKQIEGLSSMLLGRALAKADASQADEAESSMLQGMEMLEALQLRPLCCWGHCFLGEFYTDTSQRDKAIKHLQKSETASREMGMDYWRNRAQEILARL